MINLPGTRAVLDPADFTGLESAVKGEGNVPCSSRQGLSRSDLQVSRVYIRETLVLYLMPGS